MLELDGRVTEHLIPTPNAIHFNISAWAEFFPKPSIDFLAMTVIPTVKSYLIAIDSHFAVT